MSGAEVQKALQLAPKRFLDFALLLGTDFSPRLRGVGPARALQFIRAHKSIEQIVAVQQVYRPQGTLKTYLDQIRTARCIFRTLPPVPDGRELEPMASDDEAVAGILGKYGFHRWLVRDSTGWDHVDGLEGNYFYDDPSCYPL